MDLPANRGISRNRPLYASQRTRPLQDDPRLLHDPGGGKPSRSRGAHEAVRALLYSWRQQRGGAAPRHPRVAHGGRDCRQGGCVFRARVGDAVKRFLLLCLTPICLFAAEPLSPRIANYEIKAAFNPATKTIEGEETLTWTALGENPLSSLQFHLYWNAFRDSKST